MSALFDAKLAAEELAVLLRIEPRRRGKLPGEILTVRIAARLCDLHDAHSGRPDFAT